MILSQLDGKLAVVTGGSSGIGYSIAKGLACRGANILLVARNQDKLDDAAEKLRGVSSSNIEVLSADITQAEDVERLKKAVHSIAKAADIVVNSAGIVSAGLLDETPISEWHRLHDINVFGLVQMLQSLIPAMREQSKLDGQERHIVNMASAAGLMGMQGMSAYGATKAAVIALSASLRVELAPLKIGVTVVCPDFVQTPIAEAVQLFGRMKNPQTKKGIQKRFKAAGLTPEIVAAKTLVAMEKNQSMVVVGKEAIWGYRLKRLSPKLVERMLSKMMRS